MCYCKCLKVCYCKCLKVCYCNANLRLKTIEHTLKKLDLMCKKMVYSQHGWVEQKNRLRLLKPFTGSVLWAQQNHPGGVTTAPNAPIIYPQSKAARPRLHMFAACVLTHDRDVVLDQEQSFLAALHQHRQSVGVLLPV